MLRCPPSSLQVGSRRARVGPAVLKESIPCSWLTVLGRVLWRREPRVRVLRLHRRACRGQTADELRLWLTGLVSIELPPVHGLWKTGSPRFGWSSASCAAVSAPHPTWASATAVQLPMPSYSRKLFSRYNFVSNLSRIRAVHVQLEAN